jgi:hypothetical protein
MTHLWDPQTKKKQHILMVARSPPKNFQTQHRPTSRGREPNINPNNRLFNNFECKPFRLIEIGLRIKERRGNQGEE